jgi:hypothetical protein
VPKVEISGDRGLPFDGGARRCVKRGFTHLEGGSKDAKLDERHLIRLWLVDEMIWLESKLQAVEARDLFPVDGRDIGGSTGKGIRGRVPTSSMTIEGEERGGLGCPRVGLGTRGPRARELPGFWIAVLEMGAEEVRGR